MTTRIDQRLKLPSVNVTDEPPDLDQLLLTLRESRKMLEWEDDWDGEGSPSYSEATWNRARDFLVNNATDLWNTYRLNVEPPRVLPGPDGSIDIFWQTDQLELLVNVPADSEELATYFGDTKAGHKVKGSFNISSKNRWLLTWLTQ